MLSGGGLIPFRRLTDPLQIPVGPEAGRFNVPENFIPKEANAFWVVNANLFWVRLKGSPDKNAAYAAVTDTPPTGWLWMPGYTAVFTTQFPVWMSTLAVSRQGIAAGSGFIELAYGMGG